MLSVVSLSQFLLLMSIGHRNFKDLAYHDTSFEICVVSLDCFLIFLFLVIFHSEILILFVVPHSCYLEESIVGIILTLLNICKKINHGSSKSSRCAPSMVCKSLPLINGANILGLRTSMANACSDLMFRWLILIVL